MTFRSQGLEYVVSEAGQREVARHWLTEGLPSLQCSQSGREDADCPTTKNSRNGASSGLRQTMDYAKECFQKGERPPWANGGRWVASSINTDGRSAPGLTCDTAASNTASASRLSYLISLLPTFMRPSGPEDL